MTFTASNLTRLAALAVIASAPAALAQEAEPATGTIDQVQLGDVWADMDVYVPSSAESTASTATAVGNTAAALNDSGDVRSMIGQTFQAASRATNRLRGYSTGATLATTTAYGNASSGGTNDGYNAYYAEQDASGTVSAGADIDVIGAEAIASATTAIANVSTTDNNFGNNFADQAQYSAATVNADTEADMRSNGYAATFATTAGANASSSTGYTSSSYNRAIQETWEGSSVSGSTDVRVEDGTNVTAATNSFGNSATVNNEWGYATLGLEGAPATQVNGADIDAESTVTLDLWSGYAAATSYGVGNSALITNTGSDTAIYAEQTNSGTVSSQAGLSGQSWTGGSGTVAATSIGNAATATVCNYCSDASVGGQISQVNSGQTYASGQAVTTSYGGTVYGSATAVGNSATLQSAGN